MRNDTVERTINDSILTIVEYLLQMLERAKRQQDLDMKMLMDKEIRNLQRDHPSLTDDQKAEIEYELYHHVTKERQPDLFDLKGECLDSFQFDKGKGVFQVYQDGDEYLGVYKQEGKEAHKITQDFNSKEEVLQSTFGTNKFEKFRGQSFFVQEDGKSFSLHENKQFRLNLMNDDKKPIFKTHENIESLRSSIIKDELKSDLKLRKRALRKTVEVNYIPSDLLGKTVTLKNIEKDNDGVKLTLEENQKDREFMLPDIAEKWIEQLKENPKIKAVFDEIVMDSRSIAEGFLSFYGIEINKEIQTKQHDFEVISNEKGSYIGRLNGNGTMNKISPYFSEKEAVKQLVDLNKHIQIEKQKERQEDKDIGQYIEMIEISEKD
ncbi:MAG: hypothetical protein ACQEWV_26210 [Bacillota bacterium]